MSNGFGDSFALVAWYRSSETVGSFLGTGATILTVLLWFGPILDIRNGKLGSGITYSFLFLNSVLWTVYGLLLDRPVIILSNFPGIILSLLYIAYFARYFRNVDPRQMNEALVWLVGTCTVILGLVFGLDVLRSTANFAYFGAAAAVSTLLLVAGPVMKLNGVIREKDASILQPALASVTLAATGANAMYGLYIANFQMFISGCFSSTVCVIQLILIAMYPAPSKVDSAIV